MSTKNIFKNLSKSNKIFIIAEAGSNHLRNLKRAYKLVDAAKNAGADAIKFQSFTAGEIATNNPKYNKINSKFKKYSENLYSFYKKFELPKKFNTKISNYCKKKKILFMTSVFGEESLSFTKKINPIIKIASFEANYFELFDKIISLKKPLLISTGCSEEKEILKIGDFFKKRSYNNFAVMHCGSSYPLKFNQANLNYIKRLKKLFPKKIIGYSDHTLNISSPIAAAAIGAKIIEKHFTLSKKDGSPDSFFSIDFKELKEMVRNIREIENSLGDEKKIISKDIKSMRNGRRSYYANKNLFKGQKLKKGMFTALRPYIKNSLTIDNFFNFLNKELKSNVKKGEVLFTKDIKW